MKTYSKELSQAIKHFWLTRGEQSKSQGTKSGRQDSGARRAVTGGKQLDGFITLLSKIANDAGLPDSSIHITETTLPGFFRPTKQWDLILAHDKNLIAAIEFKSHVGPSFGNNFNNRIEEALGNSLDLLTAYKAGVFTPSARPWLGYLMLLEDTDKSNSPVKAKADHFPIPEILQNLSYQQRYAVFCERLVRERLYDGACLLLSNRETGKNGDYNTPNAEVSFDAFARSLRAQILSYTDSH